MDYQALADLLAAVSREHGGAAAVAVSKAALSLDDFTRDIMIAASRTDQSIADCERMIREVVQG